MGMGWEDLPEEIVEEILVRLPTKPLIKCKCVSKQLESKISSPQFGRTYLQRARCSRKPLSSWHLWGMQYPCENLANGHYTFVASSNGLMLHQLIIQRSLSRFSYLQPDYHSGDPHTFRVSNPLTQKTVNLPSLRFPDYAWTWLVGFATRPGETPTPNPNPTYVTYKVVMLGSNKLSATIFSSDTGSWSCKGLITKCPQFLFHHRVKEASSYKGILHWFDLCERTIVNYDPYNSPDRFGRIQLPSNYIIGSDCKILFHLGHEEDLTMIKYGHIEPSSDTDRRRLRVWGLVDHDKGEWRLEQTLPITTALCEELSGINPLFVVEPDPNSKVDTLCCCLFRRNGMVEVVDFASNEHVIAYPTGHFDFDYLMHAPRVFLAFCPWSSPSY